MARLALVHLHVVGGREGVVTVVVVRLAAASMWLIRVPAVGVLPGREFGVSFSLALGVLVEDERQACQVGGSERDGGGRQVRRVVIVVRVVAVCPEIHSIGKAVLIIILL
eukprot:5373656-Heterocapsa_arctica.AAC.1